MVWAKNTLAPSGIMPSSVAMTWATEALKRATPTSRHFAMWSQSSLSSVQVLRVSLPSSSVGVGVPAGASMSKPAISGTLMILPPRLASAAASSSSLSGRSVPSASRRPTVMPTMVMPAARAWATRPLA